MAIREREDLRWDHRWMATPPRLTPRERRVLELAAEGLSTREIARRLFVSHQCVTYHLGNLLAKFGADNRAGMVARAYVSGYLASGAWPPRCDPAAISR